MCNAFSIPDITLFPKIAFALFVAPFFLFDIIVGQLFHLRGERPHKENFADCACV
jgi:hypothetical protein